MALITQSDIEARLGRNLTTEEENAFTLVNTAVQKKVETIIGSSVDIATSTSARYYDGGLQHLVIDPCTDIASVIQVDDDLATVYTYDSTDYQLEPVNKTLKTYIRHRSGKFVTGINNIKVTAKFSIYGDTEVLNIVKNAMIEAIIAEIDNSDEILKESIEGYSVEYAKAKTKSALDSIKYLFPNII